MRQRSRDYLDHYGRSWKERLEKGTDPLAGKYVHNCPVFVLETRIIINVVAFSCTLPKKAIEKFGKANHAVVVLLDFCSTMHRIVLVAMPTYHIRTNGSLFGIAVWRTLWSVLTWSAGPGNKYK